MALKPSYNDKLHLPGLSKTEILILALEASLKLEWNIEEVTPEGARFEVPFNMYSHGEEITFTIEPGSDGEVAVRSQSSSVQFVDYGKNRKNIQKLRETMEEIKTSLTPEELTQKAKDFEEECNRPLTEEEKAYLEEEKKRNSFWSFFIPRKGFMATPILIDLNILVFIVMIASGVGIMSPSTLSLLKWGADFGPTNNIKLYTPAKTSSIMTPTPPFRLSIRRMPNGLAISKMRNKAKAAITYQNHLSSLGTANNGLHTPTISSTTTREGSSPQ